MFTWPQKMDLFGPRCPTTLTPVVLKSVTGNEQQDTSYSCTNRLVSIHINKHAHTHPQWWHRLWGQWDLIKDKTGLVTCWEMTWFQLHCLPVPSKTWENRRHGGPKLIWANEWRRTGITGSSCTMGGTESYLSQCVFHNWIKNKTLT